uniref:Innexin n=1 Tax=Panagrolaimus sp. PS1159 TaxID=55785 RepID=A0AC35G7A2_9BILA
MFSALSFLHYRKDDDFVDRLSYFYTSSFLIMMAVLVSFKQFGGRPLECWVPAYFTASWEAYTEMFCWAQNTYWVPMDQDIPVDIAEREYRQISYYQWVPFFMLLQAFLYYIPCLMWRLMSDKSGIRLNDIATKIMYVGNVLTNLLLVNKFLETDEYSVYGFGVLKDLLFGRSWMDSGNFPRVTLCDFEVRVLGNNQRHSVQCVLVINIFNEKIFILVWLWFTILFVVATFDALYWFSISLFHRDRFRFVLRHLELTSDPDRPDLFRKEKRKQVEHFLKTYLKVDGVLILRMVALHAGVMYCTEITDALWRRYLSQHPENLIEEDSALINFARTQSVRRTRRTSGEGSGGGPGPPLFGGSGSLQPNHNGSHQRLSRFLSHHTGSFRLHRGKQSSKQQSGPSRSQSPGESHNSGGPLSAPPTGMAPTVIQITPSSRPSSRAGFHAQLSSIDSNPQSPTTASTEGSGIAHRGSSKAAAAFRSIKSSSKGSASDSPVLL